MRAIGAALLAGIVLAAGTACGSGSPEDPTRSADPSLSPSASVDPATRVPRSGVVYLRAWAATDIPTMIAASRPGSPARVFADYWSDAYRAGRLDTGPGKVTIRPRWVGVRFGKEAYRFTGAQTGPDGRLVTWTSRPGGPLAGRVVGGPPVSVRLGPARVTARNQYVNGDGDLRVSLRIVATAETDLGAVRYRPGGTATLGAAGTTGVITAADGVTWAIASVESAQPGGALTLRSYDRAGRTTASGVLRLP